MRVKSRAEVNATREGGATERTPREGRRQDTGSRAASSNGKEKTQRRDRAHIETKKGGGNTSK